MILYLHGFRSSPSSYKARLLAEALAERGRQREWACPQLPASPRAAMTLAEGLARDMLAPSHAAGRELTLVGSSLGGYYATWLAERLGCRAALLNPVVHAARDLATQVGEHLSYHDGQPFTFTTDHVEELKAYAVARITRPGRYYLLAATGDEVLDWREMRDHYPGARQHIIEGGDHGISDFGRYLPEVLDFADAAANEESSPG
ncbi:MAG: YqiA/YcfP family alpha/beta fold hydrolase [Pigmentiphaga sp.]|uniref:YqiA/YcfP family alpha/beta fold hydrolase n=1 Tax=Pigmentiphaga sp. TaxID=1977564 RepID=UPI0029B4953E|nr:YqiA/YcfP family alpha/beta fold hydrolase [Pigmentiphaga sp.]MDX3904931.1 YqiA/YcfP family alpha/beta fold hydrolase [Pigmentiphaga sp.]